MTQPARGSLVVDTSAAVAVILGEPGCDELAVHLENALARLMPAAVRVELGIVIEARLWPAGQTSLTGSSVTRRSTPCLLTQTWQPGR